MDLPVDLSSPRVQAAMRIMGATVQNLTPRPPPDLKKEGMTAAQAELAKTKHEKSEIRRKRLVQEIDDTANALQEADVDALLSPNVVSPEKNLLSPHKKGLTPSMKDLMADKKDDHEGSSNVKSSKDGRVTTMQDMLERMAIKQKDDFEETRKQTKADIGRMLTEKEESYNRHEKECEKLEKEKEILREINKEKKREALERAQRRDAKHMKNAERLQEAQKAERAKMRERWTEKKEKLDVAFEKAKEKSGDESKKQENKERMERFLESRSKLGIDVQKQRRIEAYQMQVAEEPILKDRRLEEKHAQMLQKQDEWGAKFTKKMNYVHLKQHEDEVKRETEFKERAEKLGSARERADELQKEKLSTLAAEKSKRLAKLGTNQAANKEAYKEQVKKWKQVSIAGVERVNTFRESRQDDAKQKLIETRDMMTGMVQEEKARIKRADDYARNQTIARVTSNAARVQALMEQKDALLKSRAAAQKEALIEKSHMKVTIEMLKDPHPKKVNQIRKDLDMPLLVTGENKEGEEGQENK